MGGAAAAVFSRRDAGGSNRGNDDEGEQK